MANYGFLSSWGLYNHFLTFSHLSANIRTPFFLNLTLYCYITSSLLFIAFWLRASVLPAPVHTLSDMRKLSC